MEDVSEVGFVGAAARPRVGDGRRSNRLVAVQVLRTHRGTGTGVNGLGHIGDVVGDTVGVGFGHAGHRSISVLQNHHGAVHVFGGSRDVGLQRDVNLSETAELTCSSDFHGRGVDGTFNELHVGRAGQQNILRVGHDHIGEEEVSITVGFNSHSVVFDVHAVELNVSTGSRTVLEGCTRGSHDGTGEVATKVGLVVDTSHGLVLEVDVLKVQLTRGRVSHEHTVVSA